MIGREKGAGGVAGLIGFRFESGSVEVFGDGEFDQGAYWFEI